MKTFKILFAAVIIAGFATSAMADTPQATQDITGRAEIMAPIVINADGDLDFDLVSQGINKTIGFNNNVTDGTATGDENTGRFEVEAATGSHVSFNFSTLPSNLQIGEEGATMPIVYTAAWGNTNDGSDLEEDLGAVIQGEGDTVKGVEDGKFYVFLGGTVQPTNTQEAGVYTADITLTAEYN